MKEKSLRKVIENINKVEILELKSTITKTKTKTKLNGWFRSRVERADERISKLENKTTGLPWWSSG